jgi:hypothetical protein
MKWGVKAGRFGHYDTIAAVSLTSQGDGVVVLHSVKEGCDVILSVAPGETNVAFTFVAHLVLLAKAVKHKIEVKVVKPGESIIVNNSGKPNPKAAKPLRVDKDPNAVEAGTRWTKAGFVFK